MHTAILGFWEFGYKDGYNKLQSQILNRYIFNNINKRRHHFILKPIFAMYNFDRLTNNNAAKTESFILYNSDVCLICLNN